EKMLKSNLAELATMVTEEQLEVSHRRLFVKLWVRLLDQLRLGGERVLAADEIQGIVRDEQVHLLEEEEPSDVLTFFGNPVPKKKPEEEAGSRKGKGGKKKS